MSEKKIIGHCCACRADLGKDDVAVSMRGDTIQLYCRHCAERLLQDAVVGAVLKNIAPARYTEMVAFADHVGVVLGLKE